MIPLVIVVVAGVSAWLVACAARSQNAGGRVGRELRFRTRSCRSIQALVRRTRVRRDPRDNFRMLPRHPVAPTSGVCGCSPHPHVGITSSTINPRAATSSFIWMRQVRCCPYDSEIGDSFKPSHFEGEGRDFVAAGAGIHIDDDVPTHRRLNGR